MRKKMLFVIATIVAFALFVPSVLAAAVTTEEQFVTAVEEGNNIEIKTDLSIKLEEDITVTSKVTIGAFSGQGASVTIDLNGHTVKLAGSNAQLYVQKTGKLIIDDSVGNGLITNKDATSSNSYLVQVSGECKINGGTLESAVQNSTPLYIQNETSACTLNDGTIINSYSKGGKAVYVNKGTFTMNGGKVENKAAGSDGLTTAIDGYNFIMTGGTIEAAGTAITATTSNVEITGGTINAGYFGLHTRCATIEPAEDKEVNITAGRAAIIAYSAPSTGKGNKIYGGNFEAPVLMESKYVSDATNVEVYGGTFSVDVSDYVVDGKYAEIVENGYEVKDKVIAIGNKTYATLVDAIAAVPKNGETATTIKLLDNLTSGEGIMTIASEPKNIIFDLNGKTLTFAEGALVGSSGTKSQNIHIEKGSTIVFKNGKMIASADSRMFLQNYCDLTLLDVSIDTTGVTTTNKYYAVSLNQGTINITGNTSIKSKSVAFDAYWWPDFGYTKGALVTVNTTGTIEGIIEVDASKNPEDSKTILEIENINHTGSLNVLKDELKDNVSISGGKYSTDVDAYVVDGKYAEKNGNVYEIKEYSQNAEITPVDPEEEVKDITVGLTDNEETADTLIESLDEAIAADSELEDKIKNTHVVVVVDVVSVKKEQLEENVITEIEKATKHLTVADYFDINVLINDDEDNTLGIIPELTKEIELIVLLPEKLVNTDKKVNRKYYIVREHNGEVEIINDVKLSDDGKNLIFKSNKFSTYALAYEDEAVQEELPPKTNDINLVILIGTILVGLTGAAIVLRKRFAKCN